MKLLAKNSCRSIALCLLLLTSNIAQAADSMDRLLRISGLDRQLAEVPEQMSAAISQGVSRQSQINFDDGLSQMITQTLIDADFFGTISKKMVGEFSEPQINQLSSWYGSQLGQQITELEVRAGTSDQQERVAAQINSLLADEKNVTRATRMEERLQAVDYTMVIAEISQLAIIDGMLANNPEAAAARDSIVEQLGKGLEQARPQIEQATIASLAHTYQSLSDAQIDSYLSFLKRPESEAFNNRLQDELANVMRLAFDNLGKQLGAYIRQQAKTAPP